jgi:repressor LexA
MTVLTPSQQRVLRFLRNYVTTVGYPPSIREIADGVHLKSGSTVHYHLKTLEALGFVRRDMGRPRGLVILPPPGKS